MSIFKSTASNGGGEVELPDEDTYPAVVVGIIDIGTHLKAVYGKQGEYEKQRQVVIAYQLGESKKDGTPHYLVQDFRLSHHIKSKLFLTACSILKKKPTEGIEIDYGALVGSPCSVTVEHGQTAKGRKFAKIANVAPIGKGMVAPKPAKTITYELEDDAVPDLSWLPFLYGQSLSDTISVCLENNDKPVTAGATAEPETPF